MPKKPTTTREAMIDGAFQLIREKGHESLTARNLAALLGCSTQPIMYQFPNLDMLRDLAYQKADAFHSEYILTFVLQKKNLSCFDFFFNPAGFRDSVWKI